MLISVRAVRKLRKLARRHRWRKRSAFSRAPDDLRKLTESFCEAASASARTRRAILLFRSIANVPGERRFVVRLMQWVRLLEQNRTLRESFQQEWDRMLTDFDSVPLFAETGLPSHHALPAELVRRVFERLLPSAREETDTARFLAGIFSSRAAVERFAGQHRFMFDRLVKILWGEGGTASARRLREDLRQAISLLALRVAGRGAHPALRKREAPARWRTRPSTS